MIKRATIILFILIPAIVGSAEATTKHYSFPCAAPRGTSLIAMTVNLQADATILPGFDPNDPSGTSNYSSSLTVHDSVGSSHVLTVYFVKTGEGTWDWHAIDDEMGTEATGSPGTLTFTTTGLLEAGSGAPTDIAFNFSNPQAVQLVFDGSLGGDATTQYPLPSATLYQREDGYPTTCATVDSPSGAEVWGASSTHQIEWHGLVEEERVKVFYSLDEGATWEQIGTDFVTTTSITWNIPPVTKRHKKCLVKVLGYSDWDNIMSIGISDKLFTIDVAELTYPVQGEVFLATHDYTITWASSLAVEPVQEVKLYYSLSGGNGWKKIDIVSGNPGIYNWTVPEPKKLSTKCKVKVVLLNDKGKTVGKAVSQGYFTIQP